MTNSEELFFTHLSHVLQEIIEKNSRKDDSLVYTVQEAAEKLKISTNKAYELARCGEIPTVKIGGRVMVPKKRLEDMVNSEGGGQQWA
ncbi:helix-turn-helix domain-containing protein [Paenactinomyces guangxiensis]|uniref:Helix-turn-helix domain-containing protein n=1 Tax=Paenactinomyces guangxiensis TaxID=1490290 RepID=A0A7W1WSP5_9BACL|nr:helix-turn-helix domain-containing protein [Paenactinomyces guangxiensis]MBA4495131.1 helix-turn-helix domain-containing protein [Paenactinomyces guangxiensis]MBH8592185.1 helix-turn-helix domain-containing protein [Paenactinomyces guangxiensis]